MPAALTKNTVLRLLLDETDAEIALIRQQAKDVALGFSTSISSLSTSSTFNREDAEVVLLACAEAKQIRTADPTADPNTVPESTLAHQMRFQPLNNPQGVLHGP